MTNHDPQPARPLLLGLLGAAFFLWLAYWLGLAWFMRGSTLAAKGQWGDMFGGANALFTALAFAGLLYTIALQRRDLAVQSRNLELTQRELEQQSVAFRVQNEILLNSMTHKALMPILKEYRSVEMGIAIRELWDFAREHGGDVAVAYKEQLATDARMIATLKSEHRLHAEGLTLHFKRRLVSQFYQILAALYDLKFIAPHILYAHWEERDLKIIPKVLLPIEAELAKNLGGGASESIRRLQKLYDDSLRTWPTPNEALHPTAADARRSNLA